LSSNNLTSGRERIVCVLSVTDMRMAKQCEAEPKSGSMHARSDQ